MEKTTEMFSDVHAEMLSGSSHSLFMTFTFALNETYKPIFSQVDAISLRIHEMPLMGFFQNSTETVQLLLFQIQMYVSFHSSWFSGMQSVTFFGLSPQSALFKIFPTASTYHAIVDFDTNNNH